MPLDRDTVAICSPSSYSNFHRTRVSGLEAAGGSWVTIVSSGSYFTSVQLMKRDGRKLQADHKLKCALVRGGGHR